MSANIQIPVIAFIASSSGSGKTTLVESVVTVLAKRGLRTGTVKHSAHAVQVDREGSDSWRLTEAGAVNSVIVGLDIMAVTRQNVGNVAEQAILDASQGVDIVLVEGFKEIDLPKIEVYREGLSAELLSNAAPPGRYNIIAVATDDNLDVDIPVLPLSDPDTVCDFIVKRFLL
jgi:molybdopterin-guanine dinucleotide biosynthesis protein MobB